MLIKFALDGSVMDTAAVTPEPGFTRTPLTEQLLSQAPSDVDFVGTTVSGSVLYATNGPTGNAFLNWVTVNQNVIRARWPLTNAAAVTAAITHIQNQIAGGALAGTLAVSGVLTQTPAGS